jgi:uncharacterized membrane protein
MTSARGISVAVSLLAILAGALLALFDLGNIGFAVLIIIVGCASGIYAGLYVRRSRRQGVRNRP